MKSIVQCVISLYWFFYFSTGRHLKEQEVLKMTLPVKQPQVSHLESMTSEMSSESVLSSKH